MSCQCQTAKWISNGSGHRKFLAVYRVKNENSISVIATLIVYERGRIPIKLAPKLIHCGNVLKSIIWMIWLKLFAVFINRKAQPICAYTLLVLCDVKWTHQPPTLMIMFRLWQSYMAGTKSMRKYIWVRVGCVRYVLYSVHTYAYVILYLYIDIIHSISLLIALDRSLKLKRNIKQPIYIRYNVLYIYSYIFWMGTVAFHTNNIMYMRGWGFANASVLVYVRIYCVWMY